MGIFAQRQVAEPVAATAVDAIAVESSVEQIDQTAATAEVVQEEAAQVEQAAAEPAQEATEQVAQTEQNAEQTATDAVQAEAPVDGKDDDLTVGKTDSDVALPDGEFIMPVTKPEAQQEQSAAIAPRAHNKFQLTLALIDKAATQDRKAQGLFQSIDQLKLVEAFSNVAAEHNLSAPLVAAFRSTPGFTAAVESFPDTASFNMVVEHKSSERNVLGLESLSAAVNSSADTIRSHTDEVITAFDNVLTTLSDVVPNLKVQLAQASAALEASEITDEVLGGLPVHSMAAESFTALFTKLDDHLKNLDVFNADEYRANPEQLSAEVVALESLVVDIGGAVGLAVTQYGLQDTAKSDDYAMTSGSFADKSFTKADLAMLLTKAEGVTEVLSVISQSQADIAAAMLASSADMPKSANSDEVTYGYVDHVSLMASHAKLTTKLAVESVQAVSALLATVDAALDIDPGFDA